jgi:RNA polymerase sigma-70 factor (sigma-E family)
MSRTRQPFPASNWLTGQEVGMVETEASFREFVVTRSPAMLRSAYLLTGDRGRAEDLLQTALAKSWPRWSRVNRYGTGEAYVRRVMYTTYATWWRRRWREEVPTADLPETEVGDAYSPVAERTELLRALAQLGAGQRAVVVLRYFEDRTETETAELLGCSVGNVKSQCSRALARLRRSPILTALVEEER